MTNRWLAIVYLVFALPLAAYLAWRLPPFQGPDEDNHFLRAVQVGQLGLAAQRLPDGVVGGLLPAGATSLAHGFNDWHFHPHVAIDPARLRIAQNTDWGAMTEAGFANTAIYPPIFYAPAAAAIGVARLFHLKVLTGLRMARLANALCAIAIAALSIDIAASGSLFLFWLLSLPMTLSLFSSCSQDALVIAFAALAAAVISRLSIRAKSPETGWIVMALILGCIGAAKPPYLVLAPLPAIWGLSRSHVSVSRSVVLLALPILVGLGWLGLGAAPVLVPNTAALQLDYLFAHPFAPVHIAVATLQRDGWLLVTEFIGVLGWLDIQLPRRFYLFCLVTLAFTLAGEGGLRHGQRRAVAATGLLLLACFAAIFVTLYLDWTPVGGTVVEGVQGRYFIPLTAFLAPLFRRREHYPTIFRLVSVGFVLAATMVTMVAVEYHYSPT